MSDERITQSIKTRRPPAKALGHREIAMKKGRENSTSRHAPLKLDVEESANVGAGAGSTSEKKRRSSDPDAVTVLVRSVLNLFAHRKRAPALRPEGSTWLCPMSAFIVLLLRCDILLELMCAFHDVKASLLCFFLFTSNHSSKSHVEIPPQAETGTRNPVCASDQAFDSPIIMPRSSSNRRYSNTHASRIIHHAPDLTV
jgi:hypothetical protein